MFRFSWFSLNKWHLSVLKSIGRYHRRPSVFGNKNEIYSSLCLTGAVNLGTRKSELHSTIGCAVVWDTKKVKYSFFSYKVKNGKFEIWLWSWCPWPRETNFVSQMYLSAADNSVNNKFQNSVRGTSNPAGRGCHHWISPSVSNV